MRNDPLTNSTLLPTVTVVMANYRGAAFLEAAMRSVLAQTHSDLELIVSDDASDDASMTIAARVAAEDPRVRLIKAQKNGGPSKARNAALEEAKGEWIAIVDADDLLHPQRIAQLVAAAQAHEADLVADDMIPFGDGVETGGQTLFCNILADGPRVISPLDLLNTGDAAPQLALLGYLKPLIRRTVLATTRYDETLRNSEDFDLYLRLTLAGARYVLLPFPMYLYRRHDGSISHRLQADVVAPLLMSHDALTTRIARADVVLSHAMAQRRGFLKRALQYAKLVEAIKTRSLFTAGFLVARQPALLSELVKSLQDRRRRKARGLVDHKGGVSKLVLASGSDPRLPAFVEDADSIITFPQVAADDIRAEAAAAAELCALWSGAKLSVIAIGASGMRAAGYMPSYHDLTVLVSQHEAASCGRLLPQDAKVRIVAED